MTSTPVILAAAAHPDDIEFMMAGTLFLLRDAGWEVHYVNVANGSCGSATEDGPATARLRAAEAREACGPLGAVWHAPLTDDLMIFDSPALRARACALIREVQPDVLLLQSPDDYMEDHMQAVRLMTTAAFCRGMRNFATEPDRPPIDRPVALYHALPHGLRDPLRRRILPEFYVDIEPALARKTTMLACHRTQQAWLDSSQGMNAYLRTMQDQAREVGGWSGRFACAEGWRRHLHLGFSAADFDPLRAALAGRIQDEPRYQTE